MAAAHLHQEPDASWQCDSLPGIDGDCNGDQMSVRQRRAQRPNYGLDAPPVVYGYTVFGLVGVVLIIVGALAFAPLLGWGIWAAVLGIGITAPMTYSSRLGKIRMRDRLLAELALRGTEDVLVLLWQWLDARWRSPAIAKRHSNGCGPFPPPRPVQVQPRTMHDNARILGVGDRVTVVDGDITALPFADATFDLVLACLAVRNLHPTPRPDKAINESARVLRPGGRLVIVDIAGTKSYAAAASAAGLQDVRRSAVVHGVFAPARMVMAMRPIKPVAD